MMDDYYFDDLPLEFDINNDKQYARLLSTLLQGIHKSMDKANPIGTGIGLYSAFELMLARVGIPACYVGVNWKYYGDLFKIDHDIVQYQNDALSQGELSPVLNHSVEFDEISEQSQKDALREADKCIDRLEKLMSNWLLISSKEQGRNKEDIEATVVWARVMFASASWARFWGHWFGESDSALPVRNSKNSWYKIDPWRAATAFRPFAIVSKEKDMQEFLEFNLSSES